MNVFELLYWDNLLKDLKLKITKPCKLKSKRLWGPGQAAPIYATLTYWSLEVKLLDKEPVWEGHCDPLLSLPVTRK